MPSFYLAIYQSLLFSVVYSQSCSTQSGVEFTFYGFPDGMADTTSFGCQGTTPLPVDQSGIAGGDGTFANPETFATAMTTASFKQCEVIYIPYFQKYFQYMDHCQAAIADLAAGITLLDLWIGPQSEQGQLPYEQNFGVLTDQTIIRSPPSTLLVISGVLVEGSTCYNTASGGRIFPNYDASSLCSSSSSSSGSGSGSPGPASSSTPPAPVATPSAPAVPSNPISNPPTTHKLKEEAVKQALTPASVSSYAPEQFPVVQNDIVEDPSGTDTCTHHLDDADVLRFCSPSYSDDRGGRATVIRK